jgi:hypothetical protein
VTTNKMVHQGEMAVNKEGKMYIMRGYFKEIAGTKIPDKRVVKPKNRRFIIKHDGPDWTWKSMDRCLTYGIWNL